MIRPEPGHFFDGVFHPDAYGCPLRGRCLEPRFHDGDMLLASPGSEATPGEFVVLFPVNGSIPQCKRLVMAPMISVGSKLHPDSDVVPVVIVEMLNPPQQLAARVDRLSAMHRVVGVIRADKVAAMRAAALQLQREPVARESPRRRKVCGA